jgi:hypothetical protein
VRWGPVFRHPQTPLASKTGPHLTGGESLGLLASLRGGESLDLLAADR